MNKIDFSTPLDKIFTLSRPTYSYLERATTAALPFLNLHPTGRKALKGLYFAFHAKDILELGLNKEPHETLSKAERSSLHQSILKAFLIWISIKHPHEYILLRNLFELIHSLHLLLKNQNNTGTKNLAISLTGVFYRLFLFLAVSQKLTKIPVLHLWTLLALVSLLTKEVLGFSKKNFSEKLSFFCLLPGTLVHTVYLFMLLKTQPHCTKELVRLTRDFVTTVLNLILNPDEFDLLTSVSSKINQLIELSSSWDTYLQLPAMILQILSNLSLIMYHSPEEPSDDIAQRRDAAIPLEDMPGWETQKEEVRLPLQMLTNPKKFQGTREPIFLLLYGQPGTGKTSFARSFAASAKQETHMLAGTNTHLAVLIPKIPTRATVIIDEVGTRCKIRSTSGSDAASVDTFLSSILDARPDLTIIVTTNTPLEEIDPAVKRRFRLIPFANPTESERRDLLAHLCNETGWTSPPLDALVANSENASYDAIAKAIRRTAATAIAEKSNPSIEIFNSNLAAISTVRT